MTGEVAYELHAFTGGRWKIQGFFDDKDLAVSEAYRMEESRRFPAVRVVEERYDPDVGGYKARTLYRSSAIDEHNDAVAKERAQARREMQRQERARARAREAAAAPQRGSAVVAYAMLAAKAVLLFGLGFAAIWAINYYGS